LARDGKVKATVDATETTAWAATEIARDKDGTDTFAEIVTMLEAAADAQIDAGIADTIGARAIPAAGTTKDTLDAAIKQLKADIGEMVGDSSAAQAHLDAAVAIRNRLYGVAETATGKMKQYSEVNATASASVETDMGWTVTAAISVDAGTGYDFADDDTFDAAKTNGVALDSVSIDFGAGGKLTLNENDIAHLVDADDDASGDLMYTNTFGTASVSIVADIDDGDVDTKASAAKYTFAADGASFTYAAPVAADVQWSAKVSMPLAGTNVYFAADEAGGDAYGVSGTYAGIGWSVDSKREALAKDTGAKRSNTVGVSYATGALTLGATYDSIKDGDQWGVSAAYAAGALSLNVSTDEGSDWSASGAYALGSGASLVAGTNYTEDAYVGVSFAF
jgi:hypothetical protein